jgi:type I restriction enzyme S subunit
VGSAGHNGFHDTALCKGPGIVVGRSGASFGQVHFSPVDFWPHNTGLYVTDFKGNDQRFAFYFLKALDFDRYNSGSAQPSLNRNFIYPIPVRIPPVAEQKAIAAVLGALDDKIELNRRMNATLEAMARALFQSWFVDFDPVRAKLDGRKPDGLDKPTAALFPVAFRDSPLGPIPQGWEVNRIEEVVEGVYDGPHATPPTSDSGPIFLGIGNLTGTALDLSDIRHINEDEWARWTKRVTPRAGDIVFSYEATLGFFALIPPDVRCCLGRRLALIRPLAHDGFPHFWFHQFVSLPFQQFLDQHTIQGATVNRIPLIAFPSYPVLNPPTELKAAFEQYADPFWQRIHANEAQSRTLASLRDTLLPRLLSGELAVPPALGKVNS